MLELAGANRTKLDVAVDAAGSFLDVLQFPQDQAAIIGFDSTVVAGRLENDRDLLRQQLSALASHRGTDIAAGVMQARDELTSPRRRLENFPAIVLLTDGQATDGPAPGIAAAEVAKTDGIYVFTIGLGADVDQAQLVAMASRREWYYEAATADDLRDVYAKVAVDLPCPPERYWGRR